MNRLIQQDGPMTTAQEIRLCNFFDKVVTEYDSVKAGKRSGFFGRLRKSSDECTTLVEQMRKAAAVKPEEGEEMGAIAEVGRQRPGDINDLTIAYRQTIEYIRSTGNEDRDLYAAIHKVLQEEVREAHPLPDERFVTHLAEIMNNPDAARQGGTARPGR